MSKIIIRLISAILTIATALILNYVAVPAWNIRSGGFWCYIIVTLVSALIYFGAGEFYLYDEEDSKPVCSFITIGLLAFVLVSSIICGFTGAKLFNADRYQKLISIENGNFSTDITEVSDTNISTVDVETAKNLGDRTIGTIINASWYEVDDEYNLIIFKGKAYRVSVLNYGGYFKFQKAKVAGIPGYVLVDAVTQEATYIETEKPILYSKSAYFSKDLKRTLRNNYPSYIFESMFFEIDDEGYPYYIVSVKSPKIGTFGGKTIDAFIIVDACTGNCQEYKPEELPSWVDHAYGINYLTEMTYNTFEFVNGYWNHLFSETGIYRTTYFYKNSGFDGYNSIVSKGKVVFYTGLTPANGAESNVGFITLNPKTGKIKKYDYAGAEEASAQAAAEGLVQNLGYKATFPNMLNVDGIPTYFMCLKDNAGLIQRFSFCNVKDYSKVVEATTLEEALKLYKEKIGKAEKIDNNQEEFLEISGIIEAIYRAEIDGNTFFYYVIEGNDSLFESSIKNGSKQITLKEGDEVMIQYSECSEQGIYSVSRINF